MKVNLINISPGMPTVRHRLKRLPAIVGRMPGADLVVEDRWVSRIHCEISEIDGTLVVRDLGSRNGTMVNGHHVKEAHLLPGDRLTVGLSSFHVQYKRAPGKCPAMRMQIGTDPWQLLVTDLPTPTVTPEVI
jgi:pSer/pThr/pTyr-binding forkhead associated (FHA) protein